MTGEADTEQTTQVAFQTQDLDQSDVNEQQLIARDTADPSWLSPLSGNTPTTPLCARYDGICAGDPFRYPDVASGADGSTFYTSQGVVTPVVFYDSQCARLVGQVWAPYNSSPGQALPNIVIDNGSLGAAQTVYWWAAQALVRDGYVVLTFDPRGQGRSDYQTPTGTQGGNENITVFWTGLVDAIDFFRSTPSKVYPNNVTCANTYPTKVTPYNPYWNRLDLDRLGIAGHSAGSTGVDIVQGYGGPGAAPWPGKIDATNPVKAMVAWDGLRGPTGGDQGGIGDDANGTTVLPKYSARVPSMGQSSEYGLAPTPFTSPPTADLHKQAYEQWVSAGTPVYELTIKGSTHYDYSLTENLPATSWCPDAASLACEGGWGNAMATYYTTAWFDRWLKNSGELGYDDADTRLLDDNGPQGRIKMSYHFHSARNYPARSGVMHHCENIRVGCVDTGTGPNARSRPVAPTTHRL
jgi:hypothetical protein